MTQFDTSQWPVKDVGILDSGRRREMLTNLPQIVYTAIVGSVMIAAFLEWFLWLAAFMYCLVKVYQKAEHWSVKVIAVLVAIAFTALR